MAEAGDRSFRNWATFTTFLSAWLLFQVQPMISKAILPWFGGSPSVWTTCMLFFQLLLLGGYAYAHVLRKLSSTVWQTRIHIALLAIAVFSFPIVPRDFWRPTETASPTAYILLLLGVHIGIPYFALSSTGPLIQSWYAQRLVGASPYRLYALSNVGSLGALLAYPVLIEPLLPVNQQGVIWSSLFVVFALANAGLCYRFFRFRSQQPVEETAKQSEKSRVPLVSLAKWIGLPCLASVLLLSFTNYVCQDVAVVPFLWVAPLSLYLITFILTFDSDRWYQKFWVAWGALCCMALITLYLNPFVVHGLTLQMTGYSPFAKWTKLTLDSVVPQLIVYLGGMFVLCFYCHGELAQSRPKQDRLTLFYLCISSGGALGGILVSLICPIIFNDYLELPISLIVAAVLIGWGLLRENWRMLGRYGADSKRPLLFMLGRWSIGVTALACAATMLTLSLMGYRLWFNKTYVAMERSFFGVFRVSDEPATKTVPAKRKFFYGRIIHGIQMLDEELQMTPTAYYVEPNSGLPITIDSLREFQGNKPISIAVIGLGTGTIATFAKPNDRIVFYELSPVVVEFAKKYFTYLEKCPVKPEIILGDARTSLERDTESKYDVIVADAFSGDAVPAHLMTVEAMKVYKDHLTENGVLIVHISNRYLDLYSIVALAAEENGFHYCMLENPSEKATSIKWNRELVETGSQWVIVTRKKELLEMPRIVQATTESVKLRPGVRVWTDQYSNLFSIVGREDRVD